MALSATEINKKLNLTLPIWQAPLPFSIISADDSAAISNAGALGILRISEHSNRTTLSYELDRYTAQHDRPAVCFMHRLPQHSQPASLEGEAIQTLATQMDVPYPLPQPDHFLDLLDTVIAASPRIIGFANGIPEKDTIEFIKSQDILTFAICHNVLEALTALDFGIESLVLQGIDAGGEHCQFENDLPELRQSALTLLQQVRPHTDKPLIVWGDYTHGADIVSALIAGAQGVMLDRAFAQCFISDDEREYLSHCAEYHFSPNKQLTIRTMQYLPNPHFTPRNLSNLTPVAREAILTAYFNLRPEHRPLPLSITTNALPTTLPELLATLEKQINSLIN